MSNSSKTIATHKERGATFDLSQCANPELNTPFGGVHSHAFIEGGLTVENFVWSEQNFFLEYHRQRTDFPREVVAEVEQMWLRAMTDPSNFGKVVGTSECTKKRAKYLSRFLDQTFPG